MKLQHFESDVDGGNFEHLMVSESGEFVGSCVIEYNFQTAFLTNFAIRETERRKGFGSGLLNSAIGLCKKRGIGSITLSIKKDRGGIVLFYSKNGFFISLDEGGSFLMTKKI